jgi:hypothetical protein
MRKYNILKIYWPTNDVPQLPLRWKIVTRGKTYKEAFDFCNGPDSNESKEYFYGFMEDKAL